MQHFPENALDAYISSHSLPEDEDLFSLTSATSMCPRLAMLDEPTLLELTGHPSLACIQVPSKLFILALLLLKCQEIHIYDNRLTRFRLTPSLSQLTRLVLSGNELSVAEDFVNLVSCH